jgi:hypothetical protein
MEENTITRREKQEQRKLRKGQGQQAKQQQKTSRQGKKKGMFITLGIVMGAAIVYGIFTLGTGEKPYSDGQVHWHASLDVFICGERYALPSPTVGNLHGEPFLGIPLLHTHEDKRIHIEGVIYKPEDITLGRYMEVIGLNVEDDELLDKKNGDLCNGQPGKVKLLVNGKESKEGPNRVIADGGIYELRFEP